MRTICILAMIILTIISCRKKDDYKNRYEKNWRCYNQSVRPVFSGFTYDEFDSVILRMYKKGGGFTEKLSEQLFTDPDTGNAPYAYLDLKNSFNDMRLSDDVDYAIYLPALDTNYYVSDIEFSPTYESYAPIHYCYSPLKSIRVNQRSLASDPSIKFMQRESMGSSIGIFIRR